MQLATSSASHESMATEFPDPALSTGAPILGEGAKLLIELNQKLSTLGIQDTIKLPTIVVTGDQSCGKSSTVEAISKVSVPKASGLCTRCPISLSLSNAQGSEWECSVYVEERYRYDSTVRQKKVSRANPLGPWKEMNEPTVTLIETTPDRGRLIHLIREAQDQILNPLGRQQQGQPEGFSPNIIRVELSIPDCAPLHFIDLPGVIASSGKDQPEYYVDLVKSLAAIHAKDENNILLLTLPANHDTSNSNSYSIIQRHNAQSRTMAVFTKIDICRDQERDDLLKRYFGEGGEAEEEEEFEYGNHIVMLRDTAGSIEKVAEAEEAFFSKQPWKSLRPSTRKCLGVAELSDSIRRILFQKTAESLPANLQQIRTRAAEISEQLKEMPAPPDTTDLPYDLRGYVNDFETNMRQLFGHNSEGPSPRSTLIDCMLRFHKVVQSARPTVKVKTQAELKTEKKARTVLGEATGGYDDGVDNSSPAKSESFLTQDAANNGAHCFELEKVRQLNKDHYSSMIPGDIELKALSAMHRLAVRNWDKLFARFIKEIARAIKIEVLQCVRETLKAISHLPAFGKILSIVEDYLDGVTEEETGYLQGLCYSERSYPLTFDDSTLRTAEAEILADIRDKRGKARLAVEKETRKASAKSNNKKYKEPTTAEIGPDEWDLELQMVAKTRAYYRVASHRFVDTVCLNIHAQLIPRCEESVAREVKVRLGLDKLSENKLGLVELMTEDGEREALRRRKVSELRRLSEGYAHIEKVLDDLRQRSGGPIQNLEDGLGSIFEQAGAINDPFAMDIDTSPNKRKVDEADFTSDNDQFCTPSKRVQRTRGEGSAFSQSSGSRHSHMHLPSRTRSPSFEKE